MKKNHLNIVLGVLFLLFSFSSYTDLDDNEVIDLTRETITKDSELFGLLAFILKAES